MNAATQIKVASIITATITTQPTDWSVIKTSIEAQVRIKNWLHVRGILQGMLNAGTIQKIDSIFAEEYVQAS